MNMRKLTKVFAIGVASVMALVMGVAAQNLLSGDDYVTGPSEWIPRTVVIQRFEDGVPKSAKTEYQFRNGSRRIEQPDGHVQILDLATQRYFTSHGPGWMDHPMRPQVNNGMPFLKLLRSDVLEVSTSDPRVQAVVKLGIAATFYEHRGQMAGSQMSTVFCPELNMIKVWETLPWDRPEFPRVTVVHQIANIVLGEPTVSLSPPPGANVEISMVPAGPGRAGPRPGSGVPDARHR